MYDTVIVVDSSTRDLNMYTCACTLHEGYLVLRKATEIGSLNDIIDEEFPSIPILLIGKYQAQSSAGVAGFISATPNCHVIGGAGVSGFYADDGRVRGDSLRPFKADCALLTGGCHIRLLDTHSENSNISTAVAVKEGLMLNVIVRETAVVYEGQSDHINAWDISSTTEGGFPTDAQFPTEHRTDIFYEGTQAEIVETSDEISSSDSNKRYIDDSTREYNGVIEHKHKDYDFWHPVSRVHREAGIRGGD